MENRNIIDHYWYWNTEAIKADLDKKRNNFTVICMNFANDFNIATVIRNSNAFLSSEVWICGRKQYDRRGTVGTHHYSHLIHLPTIEDLKNRIDHLRSLHGKIRVVGIDNVKESTAIDEYEWPSDEHVVMIFGQEQIGINQEVLDMCDNVLYIEQCGSVRSLNVGTASGIAMHEYYRKAVKHVNI